MNKERVMDLEKLKRKRAELDAQIKALEGERVFIAKDVNKAWLEYTKSLGFKFDSLNDRDRDFPIGREHRVGVNHLCGIKENGYASSLSPDLKIELNEPLYQALKPWLRPEEGKVADVESEVERPFDPDKEYSFQEAVELAFENPEWVFQWADGIPQLYYHAETGDFLSEDGRQFVLSVYDLKHKWKRVK